MQEANPDGGFTARGVTRRGDTGFGVLRHVAVQLFQVIERLIFAPQLHESRQCGIRRTGALRIGYLDLAFVFRLGQIFPAFGDRQIFLFQALSVHTKAQNADVDSGREVAFHFGRIAEFLHDLLKIF
ncbi:hypothetical protein D3C72_2093420 [compost metagenome]